MKAIWSLIILLSLSLGIEAKCNRSDRTHVDENVVRCNYHQEDIYRCYCKKNGCYKTCERRKECFFCGCPIEEHTTLTRDEKKSCKRKEQLCR